MLTTEIRWIHRLFQRCGEEIARQEILERMQDEQKTRMNTWKAAVYEALHRSKWFWNEYLPQKGRGERP